MTKRVINLNKKIIILLILIIGLFSYAFYNYLQLKEETGYLESENNELNDKISELEEHSEELKEDLKEEQNKYITLNKKYTRLNRDYKDLLERFRSYDYSSNSKNYSNSNYTTNTSSSPSYKKSLNISTVYFDGGKIIKPNFGNLISLLEMSTSEFKNKMYTLDYSMSSDKSGYVSDATDNCCYSISKNYDSIIMIFTKSIETDIEEIMQNNDIDSSYENGFKKYSFTLNNNSYNLHLKSSYEGLVIKLIG